MRKKDKGKKKNVNKSQEKIELNPSGKEQQ